MLEGGDHLTSSKVTLTAPVSQVRRSVSANEKALLRKLVLVKNNSHTSSITADVATEATAAGDNSLSATPSRTFPPPKRTCSLTKFQSRQPLATTMPTGLIPTAVLFYVAQPRV